MTDFKITLDWLYGKHEASLLKANNERPYSLKPQKYRVHLLGLGDVGHTLALGLKLLGGNCIDVLGVFDLNDSQKKRWEIELNQIVVNPEMKVESISYEALFECDVFVFCASAFVPPVGDDVKDVRMIQYEKNAKIVQTYAELAGKARFKGVFAVVSDPVDLLCQAVLETGALKEQQIKGFGLGVMDGRAAYFSDQMELEYREKGRVFGPHGDLLVVSADVTKPDDLDSVQLTDRVIKANLEVRALGYKPFIAPAISSGAHSLVSMLEGRWHYSATSIGTVFWGTRNRLTDTGVLYERLSLDDALFKRIERSYKALEATWEKLNS
ncbi:lactate/malate family dehydrogenase [Fusibacter tunisiensis]|uniref:Lactate/malate dehydrogenase N-terminal domain-containing protein n=1 Tax=Fusibacter tunisiensis TaxID=1008308 RepID=A0ABS2MTB2_9FIRM|nr:lactate dehydrogenase [Fusibacter tunisiensis]MBM7562642.1 hypothetical protein [Fusibacter tunisiensis]